MALDLREIKKTIISSIKASIGSDLAQQYNPVLGVSYGTVFQARPNPELPVPEYPYAVIDITGINDTDWYLTNFVFNEDVGHYQYETHTTLDIQVSIYGENALYLAQKLKASYRRQDILCIISDGGLGIGDVETVNINPELLQTDFLEVGFVQMTVRANDIYIDEDDTVGDFNTVDMDGELYCNKGDDPIPVNVYVTTNED